jgi:hypothetical protein
MKGLGIQINDEITVVVYQNKKSAGEVVINVLAHDQVEARVYTDNEHSLLVMDEAIKAAMGSVSHHFTKPELKALLAQRIAEINAMIAEEEEGKPPSPIADDIPF